MDDQRQRLNEALRHYEQIVPFVRAMLVSLNLIEVSLLYASGHAIDLGIVKTELRN